jgi:transposase
MKVHVGDKILRPLSLEQIQSLSRDQLISILLAEQTLRLACEAELDTSKTRFIEISSHVKILRNMLFGQRSERRSRSHADQPSRDCSDADGESHGEANKGNKGRQLPSERYPNAEVQENHIFPEVVPACASCGNEMKDSGLADITESLSVIPKRFVIMRQFRHKFCCRHCHGSMRTAEASARIVPRSSYNDDLIIDVTVSKYCDLIPVERYGKMAERQGLAGLPPHSLIELTIQLAFFMRETYKRLRSEVLASLVIHADETPHRMLEGDARKNWFLWAFMNLDSCFFECHDTRSGDVAGGVLKAAGCEVLVSDVYSGYRKATREANEARLSVGLTPIDSAFCNAHARRGFTVAADDGVQEASFMIDKYAEIYALEDLCNNKDSEAILEVRSKMQPIFEQMRRHCEAAKDGFSNKSSTAQAMNYFLKNFEGLTLFVLNPHVSIDNNAAERALRSPVIGRKTWYGTHSRRGAEASAIHFSLVESCKLNKVNPRDYYRASVRRAHSKLPPITPREYRLILEAGESP